MNTYIYRPFSFGQLLLFVMYPTRVKLFDSMWLYDVGVDCNDTYTVSKFLNRCLGLRLNKQRLMTNYFLKHLESEIYAAKSAGKFSFLFVFLSLTPSHFIYRHFF